MTRLTDKVVINNQFVGYCAKHNEEKEYRITNRNGTNDTSTLPEIIQKLGQLEDIEEELGIDLITLINIFDKGFYALIKGRYSKERYLFHFDARDIELCIDSKSLIIYYEKWSEAVYCEYNFKDYGKTWSLVKEDLTKEELENDK